MRIAVAGKEAEGLEHLDRAWRLADRFSLADQAAQWACDLAEWYHQHNTPTAAVLWYERALVAARLDQDSRLEMRIAGSLGDLMGTLCEYQKAVDAYEQAMHLAEQLGDRDQMAKFCLGGGRARLSLGDADGGAKLLARASAIGRDTGE